MILLLFSMILRPVGFKYRSKVDAQCRRDSWDWAFLISGVLPMIICGAVMGLLSLALSAYEGGTMLMIRGEEPIYGRARRFAVIAGFGAAGLFLADGIWVQVIKGFAFTGPVALLAHRPVLGWWLGALAWIGTIGTVGLTMFPF